jgi:hypothetical protein
MAPTLHLVSRGPIDGHTLDLGGYLNFMKPSNPLIHCGLALLTFAAVLLAAPISVQSQNMQQNMSQNMTPQDQDDVTRRQLADFDNFLDNHPEVAQDLRKDPSLADNQEFLGRHPELQQYLQQHPEIHQELSQRPNAFMRDEDRFDRRQDQNVTRGELANMDRFMDSHPEIAQQLRRDPSLVDNKEFLASHPTLQQFLADHPGVREEYKQHPNAFMRDEERFDRREDRDGDVTRRELANMDQFLDRHPEVAEQLRKDPSLVDNKEFIANHTALQQFLADHPGVREQFKEHPNAFMRDEDRFDHREDRGSDVTRRELANMDQFMDSHPEIAEQLRKDPSLVDNREFVANHTALQQFLADHPGVREEYKEHPNAFMRDEERFDRREDSNTRRDRDVTGGELSSFNDFLGSHSKIADELSKDPSLANNREYLENHPELKNYLNANPQVHEELSENPGSFLKSAQDFSTHGMPKMAGDSKPK